MSPTRAAILDREPARYGRAAVKWGAVYVTRNPDVDLAEAQAVLASLGALQGRRTKPAARALAELVRRRRLERAGEVLLRWANA